MEKLIKMSAAEMRAETAKDRAAIISRAKAASETDLDDDNGNWKRVATGFAAFKEHINRNGRPKAEDPRVSVSIRIPLSYAAKLRESGPGWQTRMGSLITAGVDRKDKRLLLA